MSSPEGAPPARGARRWAYVLLGGLSVVAGLVGVFLPLLPSVPFLLLAAWAFARSEPRLEEWLLEHPRLGPPLRRWRAHGVIGTGAKLAATAALALSAAGLIRFAPEGWPRGAGLAVIALVLAFLWSRPSRAPDDDPAAQSSRNGRA